MRNLPGVVSYRVFARKYRPQTFPEVVGQEHITRTLQNAIRANRLAQAYLLVGPRGIGKTSTARILAKALNCQKGTSPDPCGVCDACKEIAEGNSLDVLEIDGASNNGVENIRDLREKAQYAPARGPYKVFLIDEVHMLTLGAFNALLKTLEEPPEHVKFIFATTEAQKVPATITSRCQRFDLKRIPDHLIARHLLMIAEKEGFSLAGDAADAIARGADGGLRDAESMLDQLVAFCGNTITGADVLEVFGFTSRETIDDLLRCLLTGDVTPALATIGSLDETGKDLSRVIEDMIDRLRDLLVARATDNKADPLLEPAEHVSRERLLELLEHFAEAEARLRWATDRRMQADVAVIKAAHLLEQASLSDVIETIASLRDGRPAPVAVESRPARPSTAPASQPPAATPAPRSAPQPAPAPAPAPDSRPVPAMPAPAPAATTASSEADTIWWAVAKPLAEDSPFKYGWLESGVFQTENDGRVIVEFPESERSCGEGVIWKDCQKLLDAELSKAFGKTVRFHPEFVDSPMPAATEPASEPPSEAPPAPAPGPEPAAKTPAAAQKEAAPPPTAEPTDEEKLRVFLEDPEIQKALDLFEAELSLPPKAG